MILISEMQTRAARNSLNLIKTRSDRKGLYSSLLGLNERNNDNLDLKTYRESKLLLMNSLSDKNNQKLNDSHNHDMINKDFITGEKISRSIPFGITIVLFRTGSNRNCRCNCNWYSADKQTTL